MLALLLWLGTHMVKYLAKSFLIRKRAQTSKNVGTCHATLWIIALSQE